MLDQNDMIISRTSSFWILNPSNHIKTPINTSIKFFSKRELTNSVKQCFKKFLLE